MHKYPALATISKLATVVGWVAFAVAIIILLIGIVEVLVGSGITQQGSFGNYYNPDPFMVYRGIVLAGAGVSLFIVSIILILIGEVIKVFIDIEANTSETARLLRADVDPSIQPAPTSVSQELNRQPIPQGFTQGSGRVRVGDQVFHPVEGLGVVSDDGDRHFTFVLFQSSGEEKRMERIGLYRQTK